MKNPLPPAAPATDTLLQIRDRLVAWALREITPAMGAREEERARSLEIVETYEPRRDVPSDWSYQGALAEVSRRIRG